MLRRGGTIQGGDRVAARLAAGPSNASPIVTPALSAAIVTPSTLSPRLASSRPYTAQRALPAASLLRALQSPLSTRAQFANQIGGASHYGVLFNGRRDIYQALGYARALTPIMYRSRYRRGGIAKRIVNALPSAAWSSGFEMVEDQDADTETAFEAAFNSLYARLNLSSILMRASILSRLGRYSAILIGTAISTPDELSTEMGRLSSPDDVLYLSPTPEDRAKILATVRDPQDPRFGLPEYYEMSLGTPTTSEISMLDQAAGSYGYNVKVHHSRVLHVAESLIMDNVYGEPALEAIWNHLDDLDKLVSGGCEAAWKRMDPGMALKQDPETEMSEEDEQDVSDQMDEYYHGLRRFLSLRGIEADLLSPSGSNVNVFAPNADSVIGLIAATVGIPQRILMGSERGQLASGQDDAEWNDRIAEYRRESSTPTVNLLCDRLIAYGALPEPAQYVVSWPEEEELDETQKIDVISKIASANQAQVNAGGNMIMTENEIRNIWLGLDPLSTVISDELGSTGYVARQIAMPAASNADPSSNDTAQPAALALLASAFDTVDRSAQEPEWRVIHRVADAYRDNISTIALHAFESIRDRIDLDSLQSSLLDVDRSAVDVAVSIDEPIRRDHSLSRALSSPLLVIDRALASTTHDMQESMTAWLNIVVNEAGFAAARSAKARGAFNHRKYVRDYKMLPAQSPATTVLRAASSISAIEALANTPTPIMQETSPGVLDGVIGGHHLSAIYTQGPERAGWYWSLSVDGVPRSHFRTQAGVEYFADLIVGQSGRSLTYAFDVTSPTSLAWASNSSASLVVRVTEQTRSAIRELIASGVQNGIPPQSLARSIKGVIGLRSDQQSALANAMARLDAARPGSTVKVGSRSIVIPSDGLSQARLSSIANRYSDELLKQRAILIARTETIDAANEGQSELWKQAVERGDLPDDVKRVWIVTPDDRLCPNICEPMEGQVVGLDEPFITGEGDEVDAPGAHPDCRCAQGIATPDDVAAAEGGGQ